MPTRYNRDLRCRACGPSVREQGEQDKEQKKKQNENVQQEQQEEDWHIEDQEHIEVCKGYSKLWDGLGPHTEQSRVRFFMRVKLKRLKEQQQQQESRQQQQQERRQQQKQER